MTQKKANTSEWIPYLIENGKRIRLFLPDKYYSIPEVQQFFAKLSRSSPLFGRRIDFEETPLSSPVSVLLPRS